MLLNLQMYIVVYISTFSRYGEEISACCIVTLKIDKRLYKRQTNL